MKAKPRGEREEKEGRKSGTSGGSGKTSNWGQIRGITGRILPEKTRKKSPLTGTDVPAGLEES